MVTSAFKLSAKVSGYIHVEHIKNYSIHTELLIMEKFISNHFSLSAKYANHIL